jgi:hypothetical protein
MDYFLVRVFPECFTQFGGTDAHHSTRQLKGWTAVGTTAFVAARGNFGTVEQAQRAAKGGAKVNCIETKQCSQHPANRS